MNKLKTLTLTALILFILGSCEKDEMETPETGYAASGGVVVVNEGGFQNNNGSISFISASGEVTNNIFAAANGTDLGDVVISYSKAADKGIITVNNSQKVEIVEAETFNSLKTITQDLTYPRHVLAINSSKAYVTNGSVNGTIVVINLEDYSVTKTIPVGQGPEVMVRSGNNVYVANSGGFGVDNTLSVINSSDDVETAKIVVGDVPVDLVQDASGNIWVLCKGALSYSIEPPYTATRISEAKLAKVNANSNSVEAEIVLVETSSTESVERLAISKDGLTLYYLKSGEVYELATSATNPNASAFIEGNFYGLDVHPSTGKIWTTTNGFTENQEVKVYDSNGTLINSYDVGIGSSACAFN